MPFRMSEETPKQKPCAVVAGYNFDLRKEISKFINIVETCQKPARNGMERSPEVDKLKFGPAEHRYFTGAC